MVDGRKEIRSRFFPHLSLYWAFQKNSIGTKIPISRSNAVSPCFCLFHKFQQPSSRIVGVLISRINSSRMVEYGTVTMHKFLVTVIQKPNLFTRVAAQLTHYDNGIGLPLAPGMHGMHGARTKHDSSHMWGFGLVENRTVLARR